MVNVPRLEEYRIRHDISLKKVDVILIYNGRNHYSYAAE